ncbi:C3a anaphylatoxin chemotactic receptor [Tiliqua scincoides]|uniref:C3a anaphylatoxin chemotactic receptor n=1 Tax=Tiliqua scincoides TaxID=71010 RepID=UPI0034619F23
MAQFLANDSMYEYHEPSMLQNAHRSAGSLAIFSITFLLGLPGNGLVIWIIGLKMKRTVTTTWYLHLAVADLTCCLSLPFSIVALVSPDFWPFGWLLCKIIPSVIIFNMFASVFLLTTISIDRCLVVLKPVWCQNHRTLRLSSVVCSIVWLLAFIMSCPAFIYRQTVIDKFNNTRCVNNWYSNSYVDGNWFDDPFSNYNTDIFSIEHPTSMPNGNDKDFTSVGTLDKYQIPNNDSVNMDFYGDLMDNQPPSVLVTVTITRSVFGFLLPFGIMAACYALIAHRMLKNQFSKPRRKALRLILLVIAIFFLSWAPYHVIGVLYLLPTLEMDSSETLTLWDHVSIGLAYANSCINPLLYVFMGRNFREKARQTMQGILEGAFSEEATCSTAYSQERSKTMGDKDIDSSHL